MTQVEVLHNVLVKNDLAAGENRQRLDENGVYCVNLLGGAGCGKTSLLEGVIPRLTSFLNVAVLEGDLATTRDAERIAALGVPVVQLLTDGGCHLNATIVQEGLKKLPLPEIDLLVIENVGNPICPANFDLGEAARIAVLSTAEGDDKPSKYPLLFRKADLIVISKCDLAAASGFSFERVQKDLRHVNGVASILQADIRSGRGIEDLAAWLGSRVHPTEFAPAAAAAMDDAKPPTQDFEAGVYEI